MSFTLREIIYDVREKLKTLNYSESKITDEYLIHLANVKRAFLLKQKYSDVRKYIADDMKQIICIDLELKDKIEELNCSDKVLVSVDPIPELINFNGLFAINKVMSYDMTTIPFNLTTMDRFPYTGYNKWTAQQIYCAVGADKKLYFKATDPQHRLLRKVHVIGLFSNPEDALDYSCDEEGCEDILDMRYPIEDSLIHVLTGMIVQELAYRESSISDSNNDAKEPVLVSQNNNQNIDATDS